jgi:hypothetical protein
MAYDYAESRKAELEAMAPVKRKKVGPFVKVPLGWAAQAAAATRTPAALVWIEVLHRAWRANGQSFTVPNGALEKRGVSRWVKARALRDLERAGLITVEWVPGKNPRVTLAAHTRAQRHG